MGKRISAAIAIGLALTIATPTDALEYKIMGAGSVSCGKFIQHPELRLDIMQWVLGYVTAVNMTRAAMKKLPEAEDVTRGADSDALTVWMSNHCQANPLNDIAEATLALIVELSTQ